MTNYDPMQTLSHLMDTDPVSNTSRPAAIRSYVRHIADAVQATQRFDVRANIAKTKRSERTYSLVCTGRDNESSQVIVTFAHHHPANSGDESAQRALIINVSTHVDGRFVGHKAFDAAQQDQLISFASHLTQQMQSVTNPSLV